MSVYVDNMRHRGLKVRGESGNIQRLFAIPAAMNLANFKWFAAGLVVAATTALILFLSARHSSEASQSGDNVVGSTEALKFVGKSVGVRGEIAQIKVSKGFLYVNFDNPYPDQTFSMIVPPGHFKVNELWQKLGLRKGDPFTCCGVVRLRRGKPYIEAIYTIQIDPDHEYHEPAESSGEELEPGSRGLEPAP